MCNHSHVLYIAYIHIYILTNTHIIGCPSKDSPIWPIKLPVVLVALISSQNVDLFCLVIKSTCFWIRLLLSICEHLLLLTYLFWYITKQNYYILLLRSWLTLVSLFGRAKNEARCNMSISLQLNLETQLQTKATEGKACIPYAVCYLLFENIYITRESDRFVVDGLQLDRTCSNMQI